MNGPSWVGPVVAISTLVIALSLLTTAIGVLVLSRALQRHLRDLTKSFEFVQRDGAPALQSVRKASENVSEMTDRLRGEVREAVELSTDVRNRIGDTVEAVGERLEDLGALVDLVYAEVEETALDVATGLRTLRRSRSLFGKVRRALRRR